jgi:arylsulfatase A-like enzyme
VDQCVNDKDRICYTPRVMERDQGASECADIPDFAPPSYSLERRLGPPQDMPPWPDGWQLTGVCESLLVIDRMVGETVEAQAERDRPAYYVYLSDNGMAWGAHGNPFKRVPWASRTPLYISGPGIEPGTTTDSLQSLMDLPVTLAELGGAQMPWADGEAFVDVLAGEAGTRDEVLEVMDGNWNGLITDDSHYVRWDDGETQLFAYRDDPWLLQDLSEAQPELAAELDARMQELLDASRA